MSVSVCVPPPLTELVSDSNRFNTNIHALHTVYAMHVRSFITLYIFSVEILFCEKRRVLLSQMVCVRARARMRCARGSARTFIHWNAHLYLSVLQTKQRPYSGCCWLLIWIVLRFTCCHLMSFFFIVLFSISTISVPRWNGSQRKK